MYKNLIFLAIWVIGVLLILCEIFLSIEVPWFVLFGIVVVVMGIVFYGIPGVIKKYRSQKIEK